MHACMHAIAYIQALTALSSARVTFAISLSRLSSRSRSFSRVPNPRGDSLCTNNSDYYSFFSRFQKNGTRQRILYARSLQRVYTAPSKKKMSLPLLHFCETLSSNGDDSYATKNKTTKSEKYVLYCNKVSYKKLRNRIVKSNSYQTRKTLISY